MNELRLQGIKEEVSESSTSSLRTDKELEDEKPNVQVLEIQ